MSVFNGGTTEKSFSRPHFHSQVKLLQRFFANDFRDFSPEVADYLGTYKKSIKQTLKLSLSGLTFGDKVSETITGVPYEQIPFDQIKLVYQDKIYSKILVCVIKSRRPSYNYEIFTYQAVRSSFAHEFETVYKELMTGQKVERKSNSKTTTNSTKDLNIIKIEHRKNEHRNHGFEESRIRPNSSKSLIRGNQPNGIKSLEVFRENESVFNGFLGGRNSQQPKPLRTTHHSVQNLHSNHTDRILSYQPHSRKRNQNQNVVLHSPNDHTLTKFNFPTKSRYSSEVKVSVGGGKTPMSINNHSNLNKSFRDIDISDQNEESLGNHGRNNSFIPINPANNNIPNYSPQHTSKIYINDSDSDDDVLSYRRYFEDQCQQRNDQDLNLQASPQRYNKQQQHHHPRNLQNHQIIHTRHQERHTFQNPRQNQQDFRPKYSSQQPIQLSPDEVFNHHMQSNSLHQQHVQNQQHKEELNTLHRQSNLHNNSQTINPIPHRYTQHHTPQHSLKHHHHHQNQENHHHQQQNLQHQHPKQQNSQHHHHYQQHSQHQQQNFHLQQYQHYDS